MKDKYEIINSINDKETKMIVAKIFDIYNKSIDNYTCESTLFLSPNMISFVFETFTHNSINIKLFGGYENAERLCVAFSPKEIDIDDTDFNIDILKISYNKKYSRELKHSDFLGSILGLSIKRELIGDIIVSDENAYIFINNNITDFILNNLKKVGNTNIKIEIHNENIDFLIKQPEEFKTTITSLRVDVMLSKIFNLSRNEIKDLFESGKIFINWVNVFDISRLVKEGDYITLRGYGRIKYLENNGLNKKGKISIIYLKY